MTVDIIKILSSYGDSTVKRIQANLASTGTNATGKTSQSIRYEVKQDGQNITLTILGKKYIGVVETGRKATPDYTKPSLEFVASIKEWVKAKGIPTDAYYAIAKSIHQHGTKLKQKGGRNDIISNVINQGLIDEISKSILGTYSKLLVANVKEIYGISNK